MTRLICPFITLISMSAHVTGQRCQANVTSLKKTRFTFFLAVLLLKYIVPYTLNLALVTYGQVYRVENKNIRFLTNELGAVGEVTLTNFHC